MPNSFSNIVETIESIETVNEKIQFDKLTEDQKIELVDSLPIQTKNMIEEAMNSLFHYEYILMYKTAGKKRKIKL